jgi:drug/metabolite transporter (DMT)-like permease
MRCLKRRLSDVVYRALLADAVPRIWSREGSWLDIGATGRISTSCETPASGGEPSMLTMLDEVSLDMVARAQRVRRGFGWGDVLVVAATIIWGVNVVVVKLALTDSGPFTYSAIRYVLGGLALCGLARWLEGPLRRPRGIDAWLIAAAAAAVLVNQAGFAGSLALTNADNIAMISGTAPLLVVGWLVWRGREHFGAKVWSGLGLGLVGLVLVVGAAGGTWSSWLVVPVALANPLGWAVYLLLLPRLLGRYRPLTLAALVTVGAAVMLVPFGAVEALNRHPHVTGPWLGLLAYSALAAVTLTTWLYLPGVRRLGPARTTVYSYLQPFLTVVAAGLLIGEPILPLQLLGGVIMLVGLAMGRPRPHPGPVPLDDEPTVVAGVIAENLAVRVGTQHCAAPSGGSPGQPTKGASRLVNMEGPAQSHVRS